MPDYSAIDTKIDFASLRQKYSKQHQQKECRVCGKPFISKRFNHLLCSHLCNQRLYLLRKAAKAQLEDAAETDNAA